MRVHFPVLFTTGVNLQWLHAGGGLAPYNLLVEPFCKVPFSATERSWAVEGFAILQSS